MSHKSQHLRKDLQTGLQKYVKAAPIDQITENNVQDVAQSKELSLTMQLFFTILPQYYYYCVF